MKPFLSPSTLQIKPMIPITRPAFLVRYGNNHNGVAVFGVNYGEGKPAKYRLP